MLDLFEMEPFAGLNLTVTNSLLLYTQPTEISLQSSLELSEKCSKEIFRLSVITFDRITDYRHKTQGQV